MAKTGIITFATLALALLISAGVVFGQVSSPSPTGTTSPSPTASPRTLITPGGGPSTGLGGF